VSEGGNSGAFLHVPSVATDAPSIAASGPPWIFTGTYRYMGVIELGIDVAPFGTSSKADDRPVWLELIDDNFTPDDPTDDCIVVQVGKKPPKAGGGWRSCNFHVPSYMTSLPSSWTVRGA
jgi:hypothetical protein